MALFANINLPLRFLCSLRSQNLLRKYWHKVPLFIDMSFSLSIDMPIEPSFDMSLLLSIYKGYLPICKARNEIIIEEHSITDPTIIMLDKWLIHEIYSFLYLPANGLLHSQNSRFSQGFFRTAASLL